ncbi:DUF2905 domain-containing protein [Tuberibacillus sp. Marseille-P3662]|uniref:DUF2905 domain-containing protein n=1 Tax=Tuberibacillus sp. Marseille-P3662 TaxID=1965358 RepID=UPI00159331FF|nr:DUF2905 domain-containing protein [Tuberibacillus sp. Marseille-P3662]
MPNMGKWLMIMGSMLFLLGLVWQLIGKLPGDIVIRKGHTTFYFPIITCIVISVVMSLLFYIIGRFK